MARAASHTHWCEPAGPGAKFRLAHGAVQFCILGLASVLLIVFAPFFVGLFTHTLDAKQDAVVGLRYFAAGNFFFSFGIVLLQAP